MGRNSMKYLLALIVEIALIYAIFYVGSYVIQWGDTWYGFATWIIFGLTSVLILLLTPFAIVDYDN